MAYHRCIGGSEDGAGSRIIYLGQSEAESATYDVSSYPGYENFTAENFLIVKGSNASATGQTRINITTNGAADVRVHRTAVVQGGTAAYDNTTGMATVSSILARADYSDAWVQTGTTSGTSFANAFTNTAYCTTKVYLVIGDIENI